MLESEWQGSTSPQLMLTHLGARVTPRKLRLYYCAWAREKWYLLEERSRAAVLTAERFAEQETEEGDLFAAFQDAQEVWYHLQTGQAGRTRRKGRRVRGGRGATAAARVARDASNPILTLRSARFSDWSQNGATRHILATILRDLFGNPFHPVTIEPAWLTWNEGTIPRMASACRHGDYRDDLPILADALEDAGCADPAILDHLRQPDRHFHGCWLIDALLGKK